MSVSEDSLEVAVRALAATDRLLVALDFDGTLSPLVDDPTTSRVLPEAARAISELEVLPRTWVAYVSGRHLDGLRRVIPADGRAFLIGSHGLEVQFGPDLPGLDLSDAERARLSELGAALADAIEHTAPGRLERKPAGFGIHVRGLPADDARSALESARRAAESLGGGFVVREGKDILEFSVRDATKGDGLARARAHVGATGVLFAGDDVTDEDGFAVLGIADVGVKVGDGPSCAAHRVADPFAMARLLTALASARATST